METLREVTGEEAKLLAIQFLGQNIGEMKELDKQIVSSLKPLTSSIDPNRMVHSIPVGAQSPQPQPIDTPQPVVQQLAPEPVVQRVNEPVVIPSLNSLQASTVAAAQPSIDPNQLELNFNASPYSEQIFNKLDSLERKINNFIETQQKIIESIEAIKKKSESDQVLV